MEYESLPIGVFDSGVGGLTVFAALMRELPHERLLYLGDTARLPYGTKTSETVARYALQATEKLVSRTIKALVVACNTATAAALPALQKAYPDLPVIGVIEPGAYAAVQASQSGRILILATESTIRNGAYQQAIQRRMPEAAVSGIPCSLFVALAEEGWADQAVVEHFTGRSIAEAVASCYLHPFFSRPEVEQPDCIVLGCTHFPPLASAIRAVVGPKVAIVDSAATTAMVVRQVLEQKNLLRQERGLAAGRSAIGQYQFLTTDGPERFARVGSVFLNRQVDPDEVELVVL